MKATKITYDQLGVLIDRHKEHTVEDLHTSRPTCFFNTSGPAAFSLVRRFSISFWMYSASFSSVRRTISSMIGSELCTAVWIDKVVVAVGDEWSGGGRVERRL